MNTTSPIRVTPAFWLAIFAFLALGVTVGAFLLNLPIVYLIALPITLTLFAFTADAAIEVKERARARVA